MTVLGQLDRRATILARTLTPDGGGGYSDTWDAVATVWARLAVIGGAERVAAEHLESRVRHTLTLRRNPALAAGQRVQIGARRFAVRAILDPGPRSPFIVLQCEELPGGLS